MEVELDQQVRLVLRKEWDPVNIGDNEKLSNEYDKFIPTIRDAIRRSATEEKLVSLLQDAENYIGVIVPIETRSSAARRLADLRFSRSNIYL